MAKSDATKVVEKQSLKEKLKNLREINIGRKGNVSSGSGKRKVNIVSEENYDLNPNSEKELKEREKHDKKIYALSTLKTKIKAEEAEEKNVKEPLTTKKVMFPDGTVYRIQKEAIDNPNLFWLEPQTSFSVKNEMDCQLDFPISAKAFLF
ncbi:unnamed protein product [Lactuca virosa]|uniref:Uncharacterized protein n=1 Tax=Lactuca virosa TaxID=75947 RepID=A0AAU9MVX7_9ASTR|nr:unnamed protein product [Lactuca virosa]